MTRGIDRKAASEKWDSIIEQTGVKYHPVHALGVEMGKATAEGRHEDAERLRLRVLEEFPHRGRSV